MSHDLPLVRVSSSSSTTNTDTNNNNQSTNTQPSPSQSSIPATTSESPRLSTITESEMPLSTGKRRTIASLSLNNNINDSSSALNSAATSTTTNGPNSNTNNVNSNINSTNNNSKSTNLHINMSNDTPLLKPSMSTNSSSDEPVRISSVSKRRRLILYTLAFAVMLAMSSVLDVRRAALRNRHAKLQLSLPSASLSTLSDNHVDTSTNTDVDPDIDQRKKLDDNVNQNKETIETQRQPPVSVDKLPQLNINDVNDKLDSTSTTTSTSTKHEYKISQQELDDGVDQLIAHVDQEENAAVSASLNNSTSVDDDLTDQESSVGNDKSITQKNQQQITDDSKSSKSTSQNHDTTSTTSTITISTADTNINSTSINDDVKLNAEDTFHAAVIRLNDLLKDDKQKLFVDENDLRTLRALELQATRGDCELKSGSSLFKTDIEAASNLDIERTHPLWGAWCLFMGSYKSDAMRDYVTKELVVEQKVNSLKNNATSLTLTNNISDNNESNKFDSNQASLDDVMTSEQQTFLRKQTEMVIDHLQENDLRHLAALSLQATFGDCGPYGKEIILSSSVKDVNLNSNNNLNGNINLDNAVIINEKDLRKLREPLFEQTVTRKKGALWGAWCVMQGKKRSAAAANLSQRVEFLVDQLTKSQEAAAAEEEGKITDSDIDSNNHLNDPHAKLDVVVRTASYPDEEEA